MTKKLASNDKFHFRDINSTRTISFWNRKRALSIFLASMMISMSFVIIISENAQALDFVETMAVPWTGDFIPEDSAWDDSGNHCLVVGNDTASTPESYAWYYNSGTSSWSSVSPIGSKTLTVGSGAGNYSAMIQPAIDAASPGDTVFVWSGNYAEQLTISKSIDLTGQDKGTTNIIGLGTAHVVYIASNWVNLTGFTIQNSGAGYYGILLDNADYCWIDNNIVNNNDVGIYLSFSESNKISNNTISNNNGGMYVSDSVFNTIEDNIISSTMGHGIVVNWADNNLLKGNNVTQNTNVGIYLFSSNGNAVYNNNLSFNSPQGSDNTGTNAWSMAMPTGGNHWGNWVTPDIDGDGIVDNPYSNSGVVDNLPWVDVSGWTLDTISLEGEWHFDENTGQFAYDSTDNNNDGTLGWWNLVDANDPAWTTGVSGAALDYNGDDFVEVPDSNSLDLGEYFTLEGWVKEPDFGVTASDQYTLSFPSLTLNNVVKYREPGEIRLDSSVVTPDLVGPRGPTSFTPGGGSVVNPGNAMGSDNFYANHSGAGSGSLYVYISGDAGANYEYDLVSMSYQVESFNTGGGPTDNWDKFWTPNDFTNANFRLRLGDTSGPVYSNFNLPVIPAGSFIDGIEVTVEGFYINTDAIHRWVDDIQVTVYYHSGSYYPSGEVTSSNFITSYGGLETFQTTVTSLPPGTGMYAQYSQDNSFWYDSAGTPGSWDQILSAGPYSIDLSGLGWSGTTFYYRIQLTTSISDTPVLDSVSVSYLSTAPYPIINKDNAYEMTVSSDKMYGRYNTGLWNEVSADITWQAGWNYFAFTSTSTEKILYFNGVPVVTNTLAGGPVTNANPVYFASEDGSSPYLIADIDEVKIWSRALGPQEIQDRYDELPNSPILIHDVDELQAMQNNLGFNYALANDIDASATSTWNAFQGFIPIGDMATPFTGNFDGQNYTITDLYANWGGTDYGGLFGRIESSSTVKNVDLVDVDITGASYTGALVGMNNLGDVKNSSSSGMVNGNNLVGGLVGYNSGGPVEYSFSSASVTGGDDVGGLVGYTDWMSSITDSYATGTVAGDNYVGGLVGWNYQGSVYRSYALGDVTGSNYVGGLAGSCEDGTMDNTFSTGFVSCPGTDFGGLVGEFPSGSVTDSFWDMDTSGQAASPAGTGKPTSEMKNPDTFTAVGWDYATIWHMLDLTTYPMFQWQPLPAGAQVTPTPLKSTVWDQINSWFWACGDKGGSSSVYYINGSFDELRSVTGTPDYSFQAIASDSSGNILVGGKNLPSLYYYDYTGATGWHQIVDSVTSDMYGQNISGITFNPNDNRFYIVGDDMAGSAVAFFTDTLPLTTGSLCYKDTSVFIGTSAHLQSIAWNPTTDYGLAVGDGVYRLDKYDGTPGYELTWTSIGSPAAGKIFHDVSWDSDGWNEAGIVGQNNSYGTYWRYYNSNPTVIDGYEDLVLDTEYFTCSMKPPSSPKWLIIPASDTVIKVNVLEQDESGQLSFESDYPHMLSVSVWKQTDILKPELLNSQVDADSTYTFAIEANYSISGVDQWNNLVIEISAWYDNGNLGSASLPGDWASQNFRTRQFNISYTVASSSATVVYPAAVGSSQEFNIHSVWEDPNLSGADSLTHRILINITFGPQTMIAAGGGFSNGPASSGEIWDKNMALNDQWSWDMMMDLHDSGDISINNRTYEEFGIKEFASISSTSSPSGSAPPGSTLSLSPSSSVYYSANTPYYVTVEIPDLHKNGDILDPDIIPATSFQVQNVHSLASGNSQISTMSSFTGPGVPLYVWGTAGLPLDAPVHGNVSAGPYYSDFNLAFEVTVIDWQLIVPNVPEGSYTGTITITIFD